MADGAGPAGSHEIARFESELASLEFELDSVNDDITQYDDEIILYGSSVLNLKQLKANAKELEARIVELKDMIEAMKRGENVSSSLNTFARTRRQATLDARKAGHKNTSLKMANKIALKKGLAEPRASLPLPKGAAGFEDRTARTMATQKLTRKAAPNLTKKIYNARVSNWQAMKDRKPFNWVRTLNHMNNATYKALRRAGLKGPLAVENARKEAAERLAGPEVRKKIQEYAVSILHQLQEARLTLARPLNDSNAILKKLVAAATKEGWEEKGAQNGGEGWKTVYGTLIHGTKLWRDTITPNVYRIREIETEATATVKEISQLLEAGRIEEADKRVKKLESTIEAGVQTVEKVSVSLNELEETFASIDRRVARAKAVGK